MTAIAQDAPALRPGRVQILAGRVLTGLFTLFMVLDIGMKLARMPQVEAAGAALRLPPGSGFAIGAMEAVLLALYLAPRTAVLGAVLFTGLFGGTAVAHMIARDPLFSHILFGVYLGIVAWAGLWLRDPQLRALMPLRR